VDSEPKTPLLALTLQANLAAPTAKAARPPADAPALSATNSVASASSAAAQSTTDAGVEIPDELEPAQAGDAPVALPAEPAATRTAAQVAEPMLVAQAHTEPAPPVEAKTPPPAPPPPADTERAGEILRQMRVQLSPELRTATIQLSPPELGRISIRMRVERGELRAHVRAERPETLQALERHVPELKATLESLGIQAREIDLQLGFEQQGARQQPPEPRTNGANGTPNESDSRVREHERRLARTLAARTGGIDTYA
jgi:flagellar hook-length control protein FliK